MLQNNKDAQLNVEMVILAFPNSKTFVGIFLQLGVKHVISFEKVTASLLINKYIDNWCTQFINKLVFTNNKLGNIVE